MLIYNIHAPSKTFALPYKEGESLPNLISRILPKSGLPSGDIEIFKKGKDGSGIVYEFEGSRWALEDQDDFEIFQSRLPPSSTPSVTLHLNPPHAHAHFAPLSPPLPPAYSTASSAIKSKAQSGSVLSKKSASSSGATPRKSSIKLQPSPVANGSKAEEPKSNGNGTETHGKPKQEETTATKAVSTPLSGKAMSVMSKASRRSKWGDDDAEPLGEVNKRKWLEFHAHNGVRTVMGKVNDVPNVRMLLKSGYRHVYVSRPFAIKHHLVDKKYAMGASGYTGLKTLGNINITIGGQTMSHPAMINEENHFDVVLGRAWLEKMNIKVDPLDQTSLTYMNTGESIPCDLVVLKDDQGNAITIT